MKTFYSYTSQFLDFLSILYMVLVFKNDLIAIFEAQSASLQFFLNMIKMLSKKCDCSLVQVVSDLTE